jgi:hypothetical protein
VRKSTIMRTSPLSTAAITPAIAATNNQGCLKYRRGTELPNEMHHRVFLLESQGCSALDEEPVEGKPCKEARGKDYQELRDCFHPCFASHARSCLLAHLGIQGLTRSDQRWARHQRCTVLARAPHVSKSP